MLCFHRPSNPYFFIPHRFGTKVILEAVTGEKLSSLNALLDWVQENVEPRNMSETLLVSDNPLWYIDNTDDAIMNAFRIIEKKFSNPQPNQQKIDMFNDFRESGKLPTLFTLISYVVEKECGSQAHKMLIAFFTCLVTVQDSTKDRLHIREVDLPEKFDGGDMIMMDPRV